MLLIVFSIFISSSGSACFDMLKNNSPARPVSASVPIPAAHSIQLHQVRGGNGGKECESVCYHMLLCWVLRRGRMKMKINFFYLPSLHSIASYHFHFHSIPFHSIPLMHHIGITFSSIFLFKLLV